MIEYQKEAFTKEESLGCLNVFIRKWFEGRYKELTPPQKYALKLISDKKNVLITAPTGSGKTFSAFTSILSNLMDMSLQGKLEDKIYCIYVSPLRALNNDIYRNLTEPLNEIFSEITIPVNKITVGIRTGDTPQKDRQQMLRKPPHILVTTPESLAIILNSEKFLLNLKDLKYVIIDELHELANNKRGVHLSVSIERLEGMIGHPLVRIGLGATLSPLENAARFLVGYDGETERDCKIIDATWDKKMEFVTICPVKDIVNAKDGLIEGSIYKMINDIIKSNRTTLVFTNTRSGTERVVYNLIKKYKYGEEGVAAHHGSLSREMRLGVEDLLKKGKLQCVVSSTSLELGIDIGTIDNVIQIGSPKSVARAVQRFGRSGHSFNDIARGEVVVTSRDDLIECSVMLDAAKKRHLDTFTTPMNALDVLSQHIVGMTQNKSWSMDEAFGLIRKAYAYHSLDYADFMALIRYLAGMYVGLESRRVYGKIEYNEKENKIGRRGTYSKIIYYLNLGTIPDEVSVDVLVGSGNKWVGSIQEEFLSRLKPGDIFVLGGKCYRFEYSKVMKCYVSEAPGQIPTIPPWYSEQLPLTYELAVEIGKFREAFAKEVKADISKRKIFKSKSLRTDWTGSILNEMPMDNYARNSAFTYFAEQLLYAGSVPNHNSMLIERTFDSEGKRNIVIFHSLYGRRINDALSRIIAIIIADKYDIEVGVNISDNGFVLATEEKFEITKGDLQRLIKGLGTVDIDSLLKSNIRRTEMMKRRFRFCAARSFMILRNYKGFKISVKKQQMNAQILLKSVEEIDPDFPILKETYREILEDVMDLTRAKMIIQKMLSGEISYNIIDTTVPSPFSHVMITFGQADIIMMKDRRKHIRELHRQVMAKIRKM